MTMDVTTRINELLGSTTVPTSEFTNEIHNTKSDVFYLATKSFMYRIDKCRYLMVMNVSRFWTAFIPQKSRAY